MVVLLQGAGSAHQGSGADLAATRATFSLSPQPFVLGAEGVRLLDLVGPTRCGLDKLGAEGGEVEIQLL
jgi:hypothetical protein